VVVRKVSLLDDGTKLRRILALGAHADDIEIGCGGTILRMAAEFRELDVLWVVFCATSERELEARASADAFLEGVARKRVLVFGHRDGFLPYNAAAVKDDFESLKKSFEPDLVLTHFREDRHQDHRLVSDLTWNTWRNHMILEYEIPKYDGDFGSPNFYSLLTTAMLERKIALVLEHFQTQANKHWMTDELLRSVARIRGMESVSPEGYSEGFYCRKAVF
jgi:LmbE family N-acetylglucosaminyl deacetylase